jgi:outer membrane lipoprotein-sorting protein
MRIKPGSRELTPVRVITFHRDDLLPSEQDLYDSEGNLETHVSYRDYRDFGFGPYPSTIIIKRPLEEYQIVLTVEKITENMTLNDDQFVANVPAGTTIQTLE